MAPSNIPTEPTDEFRDDESENGTGGPEFHTDIDDQGKQNAAQTKRRL